MNFIMNRNHVVTSVLGHSVSFVKGKPTHVPKEMHKEALAAGAFPEGDGEVDMGDKQPEAPEMSGEERIEMLKMILADMKSRNEREDFTATGTPKVKVVTALAGFEVTGAEIGELWTEMNQEAAE